jgi:cell division protein FtsN
MGRKQQDEVELVVGYKHLLSLFFTIVAFFSIFFFWGYTIGYGHGERTEPTELASLGEFPEPRPESGMLPRTLLEEPPKVESVIEATPKPKPTAVKPSAVKPSAVKPAAKPKATAPKPVAKKPSPKATTKGLHLQVAALRMGKDAQALASRLKGKGYAASVDESLGDGWFRVVVGPFGSVKSAETIRKKLGSDGFDSMARRF